MTEEIRNLLLQLAGFLRMVELGVASKVEAGLLMEKIGEAIAKSEGDANG